MIKNILFPLCIATISVSGFAQAEPFYSAKIIKADYSAAPDVKLLIRIQNVKGVVKNQAEPAEQIA